MADVYDEEDDDGTKENEEEGAQREFGTHARTL